MSSIKLTKGMKDAITKRLIPGSFADREQKCLDRRQALAEEVYRDWLGDEYDLVQDSPKRLWRHMDAISVVFAGQYTVLGFGKGETRRNIGADKPNYDARHPLSKKYFQILNELNEIDKERKLLIRDIRVMLDRATTVNKLKELWPQAAPVIDKMCLTEPTKALALPLKDLNKRLGLPPKEE